MAIPKVVDQRIIDENFVKWNIPRPDKDYRVVVHCSTYKHESYIEDALKGFVMQKTNFPFCAIVIDDGSPDRTPAIIKQYAASYPDIIKPILLGENHMQHGMSRNPYFEEWHKRTKYIAMCEGDDYWTDPHKLQKQVDFLDTHPEYVLCCHRYKILNQNDGTWEQDYVASFFTEGTNAEGFAFTKKDNLHTWITKTMTLMYRRDVVMPDTKQFKYWRDVHFNYYMLKQRKGFCLPDVAAVYRRHSGGIFSPLSYIKKNRISYLVIHELFSMNKDDKDLQEVLFALHPSFFAGIRNRIQQGDKKCLWNDICIYLRVEFSKSGVYGVLYSIKKMLRSYTYRLF